MQKAATFTSQIGLLHDGSANGKSGLIAALRILSAMPMRSISHLAIITALMGFTSSSVWAQSSDDDFKIYAVNVAKTPPFQMQFTGDGIYLGKGIVLTAAHVVGHWPLFTHPRVLVAGEDLDATIIKEGSFETIDLALLSVDETKLPVSLRLRRNPLCRNPPTIGAEVVNVTPKTTTRARIISPMSIAPQLRKRFSSLVDSEESSGSGLFDPQRRCLIGIMSGKMQKYRSVLVGGAVRLIVDGYAGYFVSATKIASFIPPELHL
jgi:hypothetical protein